MKLQQTPQQPLQKLQNLQISNRKQEAKNKNYSQPSFGGGEALTYGLNFLATNQAWGAAVVDLFSMIVPRTAVDYTRSPEAGTETMIRECTSGVNDALVGIYGLGAAYAISKVFNKDFGVKAHNMFISDDTLDILSQVWNDKKGAKEPLNEFLHQVVDNVKGFNPNDAQADTKGWVGIDEKTRHNVVAKFLEEINKPSTDKADKISKDAKEYLKALIVDSTGVESEFKIAGKGNLESRFSVDDFINNVYKSSKAFMSEKVAKTFQSGDLASNKFVNGLKGLNKGTAILGLAASMVVGVAAQPINVYLTKKKTGKSGFVGAEDGAGDKSGGFNIAKYTVAALGIAATLGTISTKPREILKKIQFKSLSPTIDQFKLVYGATIVSRILSSRDKNELRETSIKDSLGFVNWLILGGFVSKLTALGLEKVTGSKFVKYNPLENATKSGKPMFKWLAGSILTRSEVLHEEFHKAGLSTIRNGKAMSFIEMIKEAPNAAKTKLKYLTLIQFAGYLYSGLVLGIALPKLNIAMTKAAEKKAKAEAAAKAADQAA